MMKIHLIGFLTCGMLLLGSIGAKAQTNSVMVTSVKVLNPGHASATSNAKSALVPTCPRPLAADEVFVTMRSSDPSKETKSFISKLKVGNAVPESKVDHIVSNEPIIVSFKSLGSKPFFR